MIFKTKTMYAIKFMINIAQGKGRRVPILSMEKNGIPRSYCADIGPVLAKAGLIRSREGRSGGYALVIPPDLISIHDIVSVIEPTNFKAEGDVMSNFYGDLIAVLMQYSLSDLCE